jgi:hypothetical protein
MASFATNLVTPSAAIVTALQTAMTNVGTLKANIAPNLPNTSLVGLANSTGWRPSLSDLRTKLDVAATDLALAGQEFGLIANLLANIATGD